MNEEAFNMSIRKFLKSVGVRAQGEIERAVYKAIADGRLHGNESFPASVRLVVANVGIDLALDGEIRLE